MRPYERAVRDAALRLCEEGLTFGEVGRRVGVPGNTVGLWHRRSGAPLRGAVRPRPRPVKPVREHLVWGSQRIADLMSNAPVWTPDKPPALLDPFGAPLVLRRLYRPDRAVGRVLA